MLDRRYKYRACKVQDFYLFVRSKKNRIFYVRYRDGETVSTGETDAKKAFEWAENRLHNPKVRKPKSADRLGLKAILTSYYEADSEWVKYDERRGVRLPEAARRSSASMKLSKTKMATVAGMLKGVRTPSAITRRHLIDLQERLLAKGLSGKTVNNYMAALRRVFAQLADKEVIQAGPFVGLKPCAVIKAEQGCLPMPSLHGAFKGELGRLDALALVACCTGMRKGEIERMEAEDITERDGGLWLKVRGTKSVYSAREVPLMQEARAAALQVCADKFTDRELKECVAHVAGRLGFDAKYITAHGIVFHSFRKVYKTLLTQSNLNTTLVETLMGHSTSNQQSGDVERIYFVAEAADLSGIYDKVCGALRYLV